jgi:hypothetical protein
MWWLWLACVPTKGTPTPTTTPTDTTTGTPGSLPSGWEQLLVERSILVAVCTDGTTTWTLDGDGGVMVEGETWSELGQTTFDGAPLDADARDGQLWAVSQTALYQLDGESWSEVPLPEGLGDIRALTARVDGTVAVLGVDEPTVYCYDDCPPVATNTLALWDGTDWTLFPEGPTDALADLVETASGELVAVGAWGWVARWDGAAWEDQARGEETGLLSVAAHGDEIVAVGTRGTVIRGELGALTVESASELDLLHVDVAPDGTAWAMNHVSAFVDDGGWTELPLPEGGWPDLVARDEGALVVGHLSGPTILEVDRTGWSEVWRQPTLFWVEGVWMEDEDTTWLAAHDGVGRWDGDRLETWPVPGFGAHAVSGSGPDDVVALGHEEILEWNGAGFDSVYSVENVVLWDVSVAPDGTAFVGTSVEGAGESESPRLLRRDGGVWSVDPAPIPTPARTLIAVEAFAADEVYALTWSSPVVLLHFDGASWTELTADLGEGYERLWGRSGTDLYLGKSSQGPGAPLLHWDGTALDEVPGAPAYVTSLAGTATELIVGANDGWSEEYAPSAALWRDGVWTEMLRPGSLVVVGTHGDHVVLAGWSEALRGPLSTW